MRPWQHSISSARSQGEWTSHLPVHEFLDISKQACADRRHRIVLHHIDLGAQIASLAFKDRQDVTTLVRRHVEEDLGRGATLSDWMAGVDHSRLPRPIERRLSGGRAAIVDLVACRLQPSQRYAVGAVTDLLFSPLQHDPAGLPILMNSCGLAIVRRIFGPPTVSMDLNRRLATDWSWIAEAVIMTCYGRIPSLSEIVDCVVEEPVGARRCAA